MTKINNTGIVRQLNLDIVRQTLRNEGGITKSMLARKTGMSIATCGNLLRLLIKQKEVFEGEVDKLTGGRPAKTYYYNSKNEMILCIYILAEETVSVHIEVYDNMGSKQEEFVETYNQLALEDIYNQIDRILQKYKNIVIISIGVPGYVLDGKIESCDEPNLQNVDIYEEMRKRYGIDVLVGAEKYFKVYGYYKRMELDEKNTLVYILAPKTKCMGAGIMIDGHVLRGGNAMAGEIMYLPYYMIKEHGVSIDDIVSEIPFVVSSMVAIIAPQKFILSGGRFNEESCDEIRKECIKIIPEKYIPEIKYAEDSFEDYREGLLAATLETLNSSIKLVETGILY